ncbi:MAG: adenosine kinase [Bacteroidales bacterium]|jgi:sugar/nucleoside kinase (ribokinase family)|nr:adenosine kinase [Bacteroidales bacterium]
MTKKVLCIGNALVDIIKVMDNDGILEELNLPKGSMQLVDKETSAQLLKATSQFPSTMVSGGSAANTANVLANLGTETGYIGIVGKDEYGEFYVSDLRQAGVKPSVFRSDTNTTGTALTFVSEDGERTFATHLGAALELNASLIKTENFVSYDCVHVEGYLISNRNLIETIFNIAENLNMKISIDLASYNIVDENLDFLQELCQRADIIFANEDEANAFTGLEAEKAVEEIAKYAEIAVVKIGAKGSLICSEGNIYKIPATDNKNKLDTTGAGDVYAGGFLSALSQGKDLETCGKWGSVVAGNVIEVLGTKMDGQRWQKIKNEIIK